MSDAQTIRVVLDQGVPRDTAARLRERGWHRTHVGEAGMSRASDQEIIAWSVQQEAIVVTLDADFHAILAVSGANGLSVNRVVEVVEGVLADYVSFVQQ